MSCIVSYLHQKNNKIGKFPPKRSFKKSSLMLLWSHCPPTFRTLSVLISTFRSILWNTPRFPSPHMATTENGVNYCDRCVHRPQCPIPRNGFLALPLWFALNQLNHCRFRICCQGNEVTSNLTMTINILVGSSMVKFIVIWFVWVSSIFRLSVERYFKMTIIYWIWLLLECIKGTYRRLFAH